MAKKKEIAINEELVVVEKKTRARKIPVKDLIVEKKSTTEEIKEEVINTKKIGYKDCPICKEKQVEFIKDNGWFWAICRACDSKTYMFKNEYMLNNAYDNGKFNKPKV
jgi:hypothetical protein